MTRTHTGPHTQETPNREIKNTLPGNRERYSP